MFQNINGIILTIPTFRTPVSDMEIQRIMEISDPFERERAFLVLENLDDNAYSKWMDEIEEARHQYYQTLEKRYWRKEKRH